MRKILLVEDNEMNRDMLSRRLERKAFEVVIAVDGQAGVNMAATESPDLILMDLSLPVIDGWEATRRIKPMLPRNRFRLLRSLRMPWRATSRRHWRPVVMTTTPNRSTSNACWTRSTACWMRDVLRIQLKTPAAK